MTNSAYTKDSGNAAIQSNAADMIAYGMPYIANPDLVERYKANAALNAVNEEKIYGGNEEGYTDYPFLS